ncbi:MAG: DUF4097 family beta strand repeat protein [Phycisphaerales bacterium]|nr:MAG: DUF4097 family beta strand repeat protein [Phycisphaerales bacterium]
MARIRPPYRAFISLGTLLLLVAAGCDVEMGNWGQARDERIVERDTALAPGSTLDVDTSSGSISVIGNETSECRLSATITARAPSEEEARTLAEQVEIRLQQSADTVKIRADKPRLGRNRSISVSYTIAVPRRTNVQCHSAYGSLDLANLEGVVNAKTGSGSIQAEHIRGAANLDTAYGSITCSDIVGQEVILHSGSGSVTARDIKGTARMNSSYGSVRCEGFSDGDLWLRSGSGRVAIADATFGKCDASSSYGPVSGNHLRGDFVKLRSGSGNVELSETTADGMDLSSSYGRVRAMEIVTSKLKAHSGSGSIDVACAEACPSELNADVKTSYGSIDLTAPTDFAGQVNLATHYGSVHTDRPVTISGEVTKKKIVGAIGEGQGHLSLETSSGSIRLK